MAFFPGVLCLLVCVASTVNSQNRNDTLTPEQMQRIRQQFDQEQMMQNRDSLGLQPNQPVTAVVMPGYPANIQMAYPQQGVAGSAQQVIVPAQQQRTIDPLKVMSSGLMSNILAPKLMSPSEASTNLIPPLLGPQMQQVQQRSFDALRQQEAMQQQQGAQQSTAVLARQLGIPIPGISTPLSQPLQGISAPMLPAGFGMPQGGGMGYAPMAGGYAQPSYGTPGFGGQGFSGR